MQSSNPIEGDWHKVWDMYVVDIDIYTPTLAIALSFHS